MIVVDTGPLVALFSPRDPKHDVCRAKLDLMREALISTVPVLTEAFHILKRSSTNSGQLRTFVAQGAVSIHYSDDAELARAFELMEIYGDRPMDFTDASIVAAAETLGTRKVFTIDRNDFETYRIRRGHRHLPVDIV